MWKVGSWLRVALGTHGHRGWPHPGLFYSPESHQPPHYASFVFAPISPPQRSPPWPVSLPLFFPTIYNNTKFTLLTIFWCTVRGYHVYLYCCVSPLSISRPLSSSQTESNNSSFHPAIPGNYPSTFYLYERDYSTNLKYMEVLQYVSYCVQLISISRISSRFFHAVACIRIPFLSKSELYE